MTLCWLGSRATANIIMTVVAYASGMSMVEDDETPLADSSEAKQLGLGESTLQDILQQTQIYVQETSGLT